MVYTSILNILQLPKRMPCCILHVTKPGFIAVYRIASNRRAMVVAWTMECCLHLGITQNPLRTIFFMHRL